MISNGSFIEQILPRGSELKLRGGGGRLKLINSRSGLHITVFYHRAQTWWLSDNGWHFRIDIHWLNWQYGTVKKKKIFLWHNDLAKPLGSGPCLTPCYKWLCSNIFCRDQYQIIHNLFDLFFFFYIASNFAVNNSLFLLQFNWMTPVDMSPSTSARTGRNCTIVCLLCPLVTPTDDRRTWRS